MILRSRPMTNDGRRQNGVRSNVKKKSRWQSPIEDVDSAEHFSKVYKSIALKCAPK